MKGMKFSKKYFLKDLVPLWVFDLLCDEVKCVPARVRIERWIEGQGHVTRVHLGAFEWVLKVLVKTYDNTVL